MRRVEGKERTWNIQLFNQGRCAPYQALDVCLTSGLGGRGARVRVGVGWEWE